MPLRYGVNPQTLAYDKALDKLHDLLLYLSVAVTFAQGYTDHGVQFLRLQGGELFNAHTFNSLLEYHYDVWDMDRGVLTVDDYNDMIASLNHFS